MTTIFRVFWLCEQNLGKSTRTWSWNAFGIYNNKHRGPVRASQLQRMLPPTRDLYYEASILLCVCYGILWETLVYRTGMQYNVRKSGRVSDKMSWSRSDSILLHPNGCHQRVYRMILVLYESRQHLRGHQWLQSWAGFFFSKKNPI